MEAGDNGDSDIVYNGTAVHADCLTEFNAARKAAGLVPFADANGEFTVTPENQKAIELLCEEMMTDQLFAEAPQHRVLVAFDEQSGSTADCAKAVARFNGALPLFKSLPPKFTVTEPVYQNIQAVSFVALYNPRKNPKVDCGYFNCTATSDSEKKEKNAEVEEASEKQEKIVPVEEDSDSSTKTLKGLFCVSSPMALVLDEYPFEQSEFNKIKEAINASAVALPTFVTCLVAAAGLVLF
ncbi:hypothetical protein Efla_004272 [Eimeria flavescens]